MDCQPFPCDLKYVTTSELNLMDTGTFKGSFWGPRTRFGISGCCSLTGFIRASISSESGGDSMSCQISFEIFLLFFFIILTLSSVCLSQTYNTDLITTNRIYHNMKFFIDKSYCHPSSFAIIITIINCFNGCIPFKIISIRKINFMSFKIGNSFIFVPFVLHMLNLQNKMRDVKLFVYTI